MRSVLPLPQQHGFEIQLSSHVVLAPGTAISIEEEGLIFVRNNKRIAARTSHEASVALSKALAPESGGPGMPTERLATIWRQLLQTLAAAGMLSSGRGSTEVADRDCVSALELIVRVHDAIYASELQYFPAGHRFGAFLDGTRCGRLRQWIVQNYHYTKSASFHITPVLEHQVSPFESTVWQRFLEDESWHWKIYRPVFAELGISMPDIDREDPHPATQHFISTLRRLAEKSSISYAAAMTFIEQPPLADEMEDDDLSIALMRYHGLSAKAVRPLWWHARENSVAGHSALASIFRASGLQWR